MKPNRPSHRYGPGASLRLGKMTVAERRSHEAEMVALVTTTFETAGPDGAECFDDRFVWRSLKGEFGHGQLYELGYDMSQYNCDWFRALLAAEWAVSKLSTQVRTLDLAERGTFVRRHSQDIWLLVEDVSALTERLSANANGADIFDGLHRSGLVPCWPPAQIVDLAIALGDPDRWLAE